MTQKRSKPGSLATSTGLGMLKTSTVFDLENNKALPEVQAEYVAAHSRLAADRAQLVAELAWTRA